MRIRSIKPEFWRSDDIDALDWDQRLVFIGLWSYVDDNGVGLDKLASICADLFAGDMERDPSETLNRVSKALQVIAERGMIQRYSAGGKAYLCIPRWSDHQRVVNPNRERYPRPTSGNVDGNDDVDSLSQESSETLGTVTEEQRNRGTEEQKTSSSATPPKPEAHRDDVEALCARLRDHVVANGSRAVVTKAWRREARLLLDRDGRELDKALNLIDWCQQDSFWRRNILSMPKFREKFDQLRLAAIADHEKRRGSPPGGLSKREQKIAEAERFKSNPDPEVLRRAGLEPGPGLRALPGGNS